MKDNLITTSVEPVSTVKKATINDLVVEIDGSKEKTDNELSAVYLSGYLNSNSEDTMMVYYDNITTTVLNYANINNLYGGGNQVAVSSTINNNITFSINGGTISNLYGGCEGGSMEVGDKIEINVNSGTIVNLFGGGAGGLTLLYNSNSAKNVTSHNHDENYYYFYTNKEVHLRDSLIGITRRTYKFSTETKSYDVISYKYLKAPEQIDNLSNYYTYHASVCLSNALVTTKNGIFININGGTITESVYGGGRNGAVNSDITININGGTINGSVYGGGLGRDSLFNGVTKTESTSLGIFDKDTFTSAFTGITTKSWLHPFSLSFPAIKDVQSF